MALKVGELFASFNLDTSGIDSAINNAESKMSNLGKSLAIGGAAMTAAVTAPLIKAASSIYSAGTEFDAEMSKVFAIAGDSVTGSAEAMDALRAKALEMGSTTQFTATEAGEAFEYMAMAGWKSEQMLSAIEPILSLAAAAGADLGTTSDIVTDAMTAFGLSATDTVKVVKDGVEMEVNAVEHFADVLAATSSSSNTNVTMLGESFKFAAPLAGAFGYSVDDVAIALGLMANNGIKSSMAGTSLSRIIQNMTKPSKDTAAAMDALGLSLYNSKGEIKPLRELMGDFRNEAKKNGVDVSKLAEDVAQLDEQYQNGKLTEEQYEASLEELTAGSGDFLKNITQIAGARGLPGLLAIMNATDDDFEDLCNSIDNATGSASEMKSVMLDNAKGDITIFKSAVEGLEITLWSLAENGFRNVIRKATTYVDAFRNAGESTQMGTLKMAALAAAIGPVMTGLGGIITLLPKLARTFSIVSGPAALLTIGMLALGAAAIDSNNDIGKTFVSGMWKASISIRKLGVNAKKQLPKLTANMANFLSSVSDGIKYGLPGIVSGLTNIITTAVSAISANMGNIANVSQTIVTTLANSIKTNASKIVPAVLDLLTNMSTALISNIPVVLAGMGTVISSIITSVQSADWGEIGTELKTAIDNAVKEAFTVFKKGAMGDKYTEDATWVQVGSAMIENIRDGITQASQNGKDLLGNLVLGEDYEPDDSWGTVAGKIWNKITAEMGTLLTNAGDLIKGLVLGEDYTADASWGTVATKAWEKIKAKFTELKANAKDLIGTIALGDDYTADSSWEKVGQAIWDKVKEKITSLTVNVKDLASAFGTIAGDIVTGIAGAIPTAVNAAGDVFDAGLMLASSLVDVIVAAFDSFNPDLNVGNIVQSLVNNITRALGGVFDFGGKVVTAGAHIASSLLDSLASSLDTSINTTGVSEMTGKLKTFLQTLINKIVELVPKLFSTGGKVISAGVKLASELVKSLAEGFTSGEGMSADFGTMASSIVDSIVDAVSDLPTLFGDVLSAGAQIANAIMGSISSALIDMDASGVGSAIGNAATKLVHGLLEKVGDLGTNEDVQNFMKNLGEGMEAAMSMLGDIAGKIIAYIFSEQGLTDILNAGVAIGKLLIEGIGRGIAAIGSFVKSTLESALVSWGVLSQEELDAAKEAGEQLAIATAEAYERDLSGGEQLLINWANFFGGQNLSGIDTAAQDAVSTFNGAMKAAANDAETGEEFRDSILKNLFFSNNDWLSDAIEKGIDLNSDDLDLSGVLEQIGVNIEDVLPNFEDIDFWGGLLEAVQNGSAADVMTLVAEMIQDTAALAESETQAAVEETKAAVEELDPAIKTAMESVGASGQAGLETTLADSKEPVATAAAEVSDAAVQQFLLTMSEENGSTIANSFVGGIVSVLSDTDSLTTVAGNLAESARNAATSALRWLDGYNIGHNFGVGLLRGIESMISSVADAATRLGEAAAGALSGAIQEGSPSKLTAQTGENFGLGFIYAILDSASGAADAAIAMGRSAASSLEESAGEVSSAAAEQMSISTSGRQSEAEKLAAENEKTASTYASAIANALNGAKVVMNGELVGELVTDTVSEEIASRYVGKRYGTV